MKRELFIYSRDSELKKHKLYLTSWRKKVWVIFNGNTWFRDLIRFEKRNAAIMWLKRYGKDNITYRLDCQYGIHASVRVVDGYVYFVENGNRLGASAESKRTCAFARRNN